MSIRHLSLVLLTALISSALHAADEAKTLVIGVAPGPYGDLIIKGVKPTLEAKGYTITIKEFSDYVQPNLALANKAIDANLYQHQPYLEKFAKDKGLAITPVIRVPTAGLGIYSRKITNLDQLTEGDEVTLANDPTNLARALRFLQKSGLLKLTGDIDPAKASERDIGENPRKLKFRPVEAAQIPRTLDSVAIAVINGNYAIAANIPLSSALVKEELADELKIVFAVRTDDINKPFTAAIREAVESQAFHDAVENPQWQFKEFQRPAWYVAKWQTAPAK